MKWFAAALGAVLLLLQYRIWLSGDGVAEVLRLRTAVASQQSDNQQLSERNRRLAAEVRDLKQGYAALEERARTDLGMVGANETFFQVVPAEPRTGAPGTSATAAAPADGSAASPPATRTAAR
jgi:cell division protein FtsB